MRYLIDGHNLIGHCRTIKLGAPDDEAQLVAALHRWLLARPQHQIVVVFDGGVYGHPDALDRNGIRVVFARSPQDADSRLIARIKQDDQPRQLRLVTSDRAVAGIAAERGIDVVSSAAFAAEVEQPRSPRTSHRNRRPRVEPKLSRTEVDDWLRAFGADEETV